MNSTIVFKVRMGSQENTDDITAAPGFRVNELITQASFPIMPGIAPWVDEIETFPVGGQSLENGLRILEGKGLLRPTHEHGIRFAQQHWRTNEFLGKTYVVFPHEMWQDPEGRQVILFFYCNGIIRELDLNCPGYKFSGYTRIAGVRPRT